MSRLFAPALLLLAPWPGVLGCAYITDSEHAARIDQDNDGVVVFGYPGGEDCDDDDTSITGRYSYYPDADGDGFGDGAAPTLDCTLPDGHVNNGTDCDDSDPEVHPDALELCGDGVDNNCDRQACLRTGAWAMPDGAQLIGARTSDQAGQALALWGGADGVSLAVGAPHVAPGGGVYVWPSAPTGDTSMDQAPWALLGEVEEELGTALAWAGWGDPALLVGLPGRTHNDQALCGAVLAFEAPTAGSPALADAALLLVGEDDSDALGSNLTNLGDLDGDGLDEVLAGAPGYRVLVPFESRAGRYYQINGTDRGEHLAYFWESFIEGTSMLSTGFTSPAMGDFAGDGVRVLALPVRRTDGGSGGIHLLEPEPGIPQDVDEGYVQFYASGGLDQEFASALAAADLDGDGRDDLIVGAPGELVGSAPSTGRVYVFLGDLTDGTGEADAAYVISGTVAGGRFGQTLAVAADDDGQGGLDGVAGPELVIGAPGSGDQPGGVYVYTGLSAASLSADDAHSHLTGSTSSAGLGTAAAAGLDLNGDGFGDLALGAPGTVNGSVFLLSGGPL